MLKHQLLLCGRDHVCDSRVYYLGDDSWEYIEPANEDLDAQQLSE
jgi:hypothetical protein